MVVLSPIVKLDAKDTFGVLNVLPIDFATARLQDLVLRSTYRFKKAYREIVSAGGLHDFLGFSGQIMLSLIMKDELIAHFKPKKYARAINSLKPDFYTTIDGETYEGEYSLSLSEIERIHKQNKELVELCPDCQPIGLVKGCSTRQVNHHITLLKSLGIEDLVVHVGDFFRRGDPEMIRRAKTYSLIARKHAKRLFLYGMGSQKRLLEFSFADAFVSFKHFVTARNGMRFVGTKEMKYRGSYNPQIMIDNFVEMYKNVEKLNEQVRLFEEEKTDGGRKAKRKA